MTTLSFGASIRSKFTTFVKNIYTDYYEVLKEVKLDAQKRPAKALVRGSCILYYLNLFRTNEDFKSYSNQVIDAATRISTVSEQSRNPVSSKYISEVTELNSLGHIREINLGFATIIYRHEGNNQLALYRYTCPHLRPSVKEFFSHHIVDVGLAGRWLVLNQKMQNYDINDDDFADMNTPMTFAIKDSPAA